MVISASISFRGVPKAIHTIYSSHKAFQDKKIPTNTSVRRWITRLGLYKLSCPLEHANDWAAVIDASIQVGDHKCLMILGIRLSQLEVGRPLALDDLTVLGLEMHRRCNAATISAALERASARVGSLRMICADQGSDIVSGVSLFQRSHPCTKLIADITHKIALFLKRELEGDQEWLQFCQCASQTKSQVQQTKFAHLSPPNQRSKCRFMNLEGLVKWGKKMLEHLDGLENCSEYNPKANDSEKFFGWLRNHRSLIASCDDFMKVVSETRHIVRTSGMHRKVGKRLYSALYSFSLSTRACQLAGELIDFVKEQAKKVPKGETWIGSSECIESLFGKLKSLEKDQNKGGFTALVLAAAACVGKVDADTVGKALHTVRNVDVNDWERRNIGATLQAQRKRELGRRRSKVDIGEPKTTDRRQTGRKYSGCPEEDLQAAS